MTNITAFNKQNLPELRTAITEALKGVGEKFNINLNAGNCSFTNINCTFKVECAVKTSSGQVVDPEVEHLRKFGGMYFNNPDFNVDRTYNVGTIGPCKIVRYRPRASRFAVIVERITDKKRYKVAQDLVEAAIKAAA